MKGEAPPTPAMAAPRGLAVGRDDVRRVGARTLHPGQETGLEQVRIDGGDHVARCVAARDARLTWQEPAGKVLTLAAPKPGLDAISGPGGRRTKRRRQGLRQRTQRLRRLTRGSQSRDVRQEPGRGRSGHGNLEQ